LTFWGRAHFWHERWLDYRHLAESLRMMRLLVLIGRITPSLQVPAHLENGDPRKSWFHFYLRGLVREVGLVPAAMNCTYRKAFHDLLQRAIKEQIEYHANSAKRHHLAHIVWHGLSHLLFAVAAIACLVHFGHHGPNTEPSTLFLNLAVIVLPAFGGAIGATLHHGEAERIARRSEDLRENLQKLELLLKGAYSYRDLGRIAESFANVTLSEVMDWRVLFLTRPLNLPA
jgi:hypothetical protein